MPKISPIWWTLIIELSPVPPYDLNLYNSNMHDLEKKLFQLEEIEFFSPEDTTHRMTACKCLRRIKQGKNVLFFYLYQNSSKQTV